MNRLSRIEQIQLIEPFHDPFPSLFFPEPSVLAPKKLGFHFPSFVEDEDDVGFSLDLLRAKKSPSPFEAFDTVTDLIRIDESPWFSSYRRIQRVERFGGEVLLQRLSERVDELESKFDGLFKARIGGGGDRKYTWTAEFKGPENNGVDRKYKWTAEIKEGKKKEKQEKEKKEREKEKEKEKEKMGKIEKKYQWTAEIKGKGEGGPILRKYTIEESTGDASECTGSKKEKEKEKKKKKSKKEENGVHVVEIEEPENHGVVVLRQAFGRRARAIASKGKKKDLSPQDAALMIQISFRAYLIRRSQALRALRDLAVAKSKLKEIRALFNNFSYRRQIARDAEERQRFSEKIIVLLLTVDAIEGADLMVRSAKRSMVDELEAMLDVVDPQPPQRSASIKRRTFDIPSGPISKEVAAGVARVVQMLDHEENSSDTFEACV